MSHATLSGRLYLDHAATTPILPKAREAMLRALESWANPSSPHADGRAARAALEDARARIAAALGWHDHVIFTSGASDAIAIALTRANARRIVTSTVELTAVMTETKDEERLGVDDGGGDRLHFAATDSLDEIHIVNIETRVITAKYISVGGKRETVREE